MNNPEFAALQHLGGSSNFYLLLFLVLVVVPFFSHGGGATFSRKMGFPTKAACPIFCSSTVPPRQLLLFSPPGFGLDLRFHTAVAGWSRLEKSCVSNFIRKTRFLTKAAYPNVSAVQ